MKLVLAGGYDTKNLGDHAMLLGLRRALAERFGALDITLLSRHPDLEFDRRHGVRSIANLDRESRAAARGRFFRGFEAGEDDAHLRAIARELADADALAIGGGRMLVDYTLGFQRGHLAWFVQLVALARFLGTPVVLFGHSLVPLASELAREHVRFLFASARSASVREESSLPLLAACGVDARGVRVIPDPAYALEPAAPASDARLAALGIDPRRPFLALNVRSYAWRDGESSARDGGLALARALDELLARFPSLQLVCVPQMTYAVDTPETDDRAIARRVLAVMQRRAATRAIDEELDVAGALALYGRAAGLLSMRRHGLLLAAVQGTAGVALSGERNTESIVDELGLPAQRLALEELGSPGFGARLGELVHALLERPPDVRARVRELAARARAHAELFAALAPVERPTVPSL